MHLSIFLCAAADQHSKAHGGRSQHSEPQEEVFLVAGGGQHRLSGFSVAPDGRNARAGIRIAAFGLVLGGIETVDLIASVPTNSNDKPMTDQVMREVYVETYGKTYEFSRLED